jgi:hypothetical protein
LLAGQRTRVTWQLSFNDAGRAPLVEAGPPAALPPPPPHHRRRWLAVAPALALLLVGGAWATGSLQRLNVPGLSRLPQRASLANLLPHRSADAAQRAHERPQVTLALEPEPAPNERASSIPAAIASSQPGMGLPIASAQPSAEGSAAATPSAVSAADAAAKGVSSKASGAVSPAPRSAPARRNGTARRSTKPSKPAERSAPALEYGTNNAPILD